MAHTYYPQSDYRPATLTVGQLIEKLASFDPEAPVIFRSPQYGCFGSLTNYSVEAAETVSLEGSEEHIPGGVRFDDETGEEETYEPFTNIAHPWSGVVIT